MPYIQLKEEAALIAAAITAASGMAVEGSTIAAILASFLMIIKFGGAGVELHHGRSDNGPAAHLLRDGEGWSTPPWAAKIHHGSAPRTSPP